MNKLVLLPLLIMPACATPGENTRLMRVALDHSQSVCLARGFQIGSDDYIRCMVKFGHKSGYLVAQADDGSAVFALPGEGSMPGVPTGGMYPHAYAR